MKESKRLAVFISGNGSNLQALIDDQEIVDKLVLVVSNRKDAYGLKRAQEAGIPSYIIRNKNYEELSLILDDLKINGIILAGYLDILPKYFVDSYANKIINIHPSLIPSFCGKGYYGKKVHQAVLDYGVKYTGVTTHFVSEMADEGPIILQEVLEVSDTDDVDTLSAKVLKLEHQIICRTVKHFCRNELFIKDRYVTIGGNNE